MKTSKKRLFLLMTTLFLSLVILLNLSCKSDDEGGDDNTAEWTIMVYGAGNNDLDGANNNTSYIVQDIQDMEKVGSQSKLNVIAMVSSQRLGGGAKYYKIEHFPNENPGVLSSPVLENKGTKDMSDPATMIEFLNYCKANYPAKRYILLVDDHGNGWQGSCSDDLGGGGSLLTMVELKNAISQSDLHRVDVVTFHACLMAMAEVAYELRNVADYMTACQFTMPMQNVLGADLWLAWMKDNLTAGTQETCQKIAEKVIERAQFKQKTTHYAVIKLSEMNNLGSKIGTLGGYLITESGQHGSEVIHAWTQTHSTSLDNPAFCDLREYANKVKQEPNLQLNNLIISSADDVIAAVNAAVPFNNSYFQAPDVPVTRGGLNIHFPRTQQEFDSSNYVRLEFRPTNWHSFLSAFVAAVAGGGGGGGGNCSDQCATPQAIQVGQAVTQCQIAGQQNAANWFAITLNPGNYRFQLDNFSVGSADYDLYTFYDCQNQEQQCQGAQNGAEDFTCSTGGTINLLLAVVNYSGDAGTYRLLVSQIGL